MEQSHTAIELQILHSQAFRNCLGQGAVYFAVLLFSTLLFSVALPMAVRAAPDQKTGPPPLVTVITVTEKDVNPSTEYVGHVEAVQSVDLQARVSGVLEEIRFKEGSNVKAGDLLYVIEPAPFEMRVSANRARMEKTQAVLTQAGRHLERIQAVRSGGIPVTDIEAAEAEKEKARADLEEARAVLKLSEIDLGYTRIWAPISGRIGKSALTKGNLCGPASGTLARIVQLDPIRALFSISENDMDAVKAALEDASGKPSAGIMKLRLKLPDGNLTAGFGRVDFVDNRVDPATGTIAVRALFDNPDGLLLPGQYITLVAGRNQSKPMPVIPQAAVLEDRDGRYVLVVDGQGKVEQQRITIGSAVDLSWTVESGLAAGETLIVQGIQKVRPGQIVKTNAADASQGD